MISKEQIRKAVQMRSQNWRCQYSDSCRAEAMNDGESLETLHHRECPLSDPDVSYTIENGPLDTAERLRDFALGIDAHTPNLPFDPTVPGIYNGDEPVAHKHEQVDRDALNDLRAGRAIEIPADETMPDESEE